MLTRFPISRYRVLRVVDAGHSNSLSTCIVPLSFSPGELVDVPDVGGAAWGGLKWNIRRSSAGRGKVPQTERAENSECFFGWWSGYLRGKCSILAKCLCCLIICMPARFEDGTHSLRKRTSSSVFIWRIETACSASWVYVYPSPYPSKLGGRYQTVRPIFQHSIRNRIRRLLIGKAER